MQTKSNHSLGKQIKFLKQIIKFYDFWPLQKYHALRIRTRKNLGVT